MHYEITPALKPGKQLTKAQRTSGKFAPEPKVLGKILHRNSPPLRVTPAVFEKHLTEMKRLYAAGAILITVVDGDSRTPYGSKAPPKAEPAETAPAEPPKEETPAPAQEEAPSEPAAETNAAAGNDGTEPEPATPVSASTTEEAEATDPGEPPSSGPDTDDSTHPEHHAKSHKKRTSRGH